MKSSLHVGASRFAFACLLLTLSGGGAIAADGETPVADQLVEAFDDRGFDRRLWSIDPDKPPGMRLDLDRDRLHVVVPAGDENRPSAVFAGRFELRGDFEITADYDLKSFPAPGEGASLKCEVFIEGPGGAASVMRESARDAPAGHVLWYGPPKESDADGAWARADAAGQAGSLRLKRVGETLQFLVAGPAGSPRPDGSPGVQTFRPLGEVAYGTEPVTTVQVRVSAPQIASPADLTLDDVRIAADEIVRPFAPDETADRTWLWVGLAVAVAAIVGLLLFVLWRRSA